MLVAHKIIDALSGAVKRPGLMRLPGLDQQHCRRAAEMITRAQKFDFGDLILERLPEIDGGWKSPKLTEDEKGFWREGLIPLPYPVCWYEFTLGGCRSGILVYEDAAGLWHDERIDYLPDCVLFTGCVTTADPRNAYEPDGRMTLTIGGNTVFAHELAVNDNRALRSNIGISMPMVIYFTLMLNSRTTEQEPAHIGLIYAKLNKARAKRGHAPLQEHTIVHIVPQRFRETTDGQGHTHASPRLHWRRSHTRCYDRHTLSSKWAPEWEHEGRKGWWVAVIPRALVGKAELGEVSHEYRVEPAPQSKEAA